MAIGRSLRPLAYGITECFHAKIEMIQRGAFGFRNFENLILLR